MFQCHSMDTTVLAEVCGIILGDGSIHKTQNRITITGSLEDLHYFENHVIPLFQHIFPNLKPHLQKVKDSNAYRLIFENKKMFECLTNVIGLVRGNKKNAKIPKFIFQNRKTMQFFLRGLFDTDGSLKFSKQSTSINYYPRIQFSNQEGVLAHQIGDILVNLGFSFGKWTENNTRSYGNKNNRLTYYHISGIDNLLLWFDLIKPQNLVHSTKFSIWKKYGFCKPCTTLRERLLQISL